MNKKDNNKMKSYLMNLMVHVIKIHAQEKTTSSWLGSMNNALKYIRQLQDSPLTEEQWLLKLEDIYEDSLIYASNEIFNGCEVEYLETKVNKLIVLLHCYTLIQFTYK